MGPGLDIKTEGGQVVAPPSIHPTTGRAYEWEVAHHPDDVPLAEVPPWLLQLLIASTGPGTAFVAAEKICDGQRNEELYKSGRSMQARGYSRKAIHAVLHAENEEKCEHPLSQDEVETIAQHVCTQPDRAAFTQNGRSHVHQHEPSHDLHTPTSASEPAFQLVTAPDSFISQYVTYATTRTDAPAEAHEAFAFGILSVAASHVRLPIATSPRGWSLVLWILYLVNSTAGRKSTVIDLAIDLVREVLGEAALIFWEGSPQGLLQRLQARDGEATVFVRDEYASLMAAFNKNGHLSGLPQVLIKAFDGSPLENVRTKKKGPDGEKHSDTDRVEHPFLAQFAAAPWDAFMQRATVDNLLDGFLPRFVVITGAAAGRPLPLLTPSITAARAALYEQLHTYTLRAQSIQHVVLAPEVLEAQWSLEQTFLRRAETSGRPDAAGPSLKRLAETALKVAALLAIEEATNGVLSIRGEHFTLARLIVTRWAESSVRLVEALGATSFQKECTSVFQTIHQRPGVSVSLLYRTHRRLRKREFDEILDALDLQGRIRIETQPTSIHGRPPRVVYPIGGTAA